jgi:hypothetical protein
MAVNVAKLPQTRGFQKQIESRFDFTGGLNTRDSELQLANNELSVSRNLNLDLRGALTKREGNAFVGNIIGFTTPVLGLFNFTNTAGTQEILAVYDTKVYRLSGGTWTALTGATLTTNLTADGAYYPATNKFYIVNGTDNAVVYTSGGAATTDSSFKKGTLIQHHLNRLLVAGVSGEENRLWYSEALKSDTFGANSYVSTSGAIVGLESLYDKTLAFTKRKIYRLQNFTFDGVARGPESFIELPIDFGTVADRSIVKINNLIYFLGLDNANKAQVYVTDGFSVQSIGEKIKTTLNGVAPALLENAAAINDGNLWRCSFTPTGQTKNTQEVVYDTLNKVWVGVNDGHESYSCYTTATVSGEQKIYAGSDEEGIVYEINANDYDTGNVSSTNTATIDGTLDIDGANTKRGAQSFKITDYSAVESVTLEKVALWLKKISGTTTELTVRIETNNAGAPSGTLAHASATATISAFTDTSYLAKEVDFSDVTLSGNTTYWLVVQHTTEGSGDSIYAWATDDTSPDYDNGNNAQYAAAAWVAAAGSDAVFLVSYRKKIQMEAKTGLSFIANGRKVFINRFFILVDAVTTDFEVGISSEEIEKIIDNTVSIEVTVNVRGPALTRGDFVRGQSNVSKGEWIRIEQSIPRLRAAKFSFKQDTYNTEFKIYGVKIHYKTLPAER